MSDSSEKNMDISGGEVTYPYKGLCREPELVKNWTFPMQNQIRKAFINNKEKICRQIANTKTDIDVYTARITYLQEFIRGLVFFHKDSTKNQENTWNSRSIRTTCLLYKVVGCELTLYGNFPNCKL
ncbi:hypothetical protein CDAR_102851 [Caerostris darwini]|uniref:Uncharacterized protein n=1 Tax=Caerostris darwini TaxID=1538125 RepID=A0AAV4TNC1_9ARAC|nr:hypothetical protein CDAR_102851 [Caerostris darwini]